jgi:hypothetical protein
MSETKRLTEITSKILFEDKFAKLESGKFECLDCGKIYKQSSAKRHFLTVHPDVRERYANDYDSQRRQKEYATSTFPLPSEFKTELAVFPARNAGIGDPNKQFSAHLFQIQNEDHQKSEIIDWFKNKCVEEWNSFAQSYAPKTTIQFGVITMPEKGPIIGYFSFDPSVSVLTLRNFFRRVKLPHSPGSDPKPLFLEDYIYEYSPFPYLKLLHRNIESLHDQHPPPTTIDERHYNNFSVVQAIFRWADSSAVQCVSIGPKAAEVDPIVVAPLEMPPRFAQSMEDSLCGFSSSEELQQWLDLPFVRSLEGMEYDSKSTKSFTYRNIAQECSAWTRGAIRCIGPNGEFQYVTITLNDDLDEVVRAWKERGFVGDSFEKNNITLRLAGLATRGCMLELLDKLHYSGKTYAAANMETNSVTNDANKLPCGEIKMHGALLYIAERFPPNQRYYRTETRAICVSWGMIPKEQTNYEEDDVRDSKGLGMFTVPVPTMFDAIVGKLLYMCNYWRKWSFGEQRAYLYKIGLPIVPFGFLTFCFGAPGTMKKLHMIPSSVKGHVRVHLATSQEASLSQPPLREDNRDTEVAGDIADDVTSGDVASGNVAGDVDVVMVGTGNDVDEAVEVLNVLNVSGNVIARGLALIHQRRMEMEQEAMEDGEEYSA